MKQTLFETFLGLNPALVILIVGIPLALVIWLGVRLSARRGADREAADFGKEALAIIAGGFIFVGAFAIVTSWDNQSKLAQSVTNEFSSTTSLGEDLGKIGNSSAGSIAEELLAYAKLVKQTEIGTLGVVTPNPQAQKQLALIEADVDTIVNSSALTTHQVDNLYSHLEALKDARKDRLTVTVPNLPPSILLLMLLSAALALFGIAIYPPSQRKWVKLYYLGASLSVVVALIVTVFVLQSPVNAAQQVSKPIDLFIGSMTEGGANLQLQNGDLPAGGQPAGAPSMLPPSPRPTP